MFSKFKLLVPVVAIAALSACEAYEKQMGPKAHDIASVKAMDPMGSDFQKALHSEYIGHGQFEIDEVDWSAAEYHLSKAITAGMGETPMMTQMGEREILPEFQDELAAVGARLQAAFDGGSTESMPAESAKAQGLYDCWQEQQEENFQPEDIAMCRDPLLALLPTLETEPMMKPVAGPFTVYFGFDSAELTGAAVAELELAVASMPEGSKMLVKAYTDTSGDAMYNAALAKKRAMSVSEFLSAKGVEAAKVDEVALGESELAIQTGDGVKEARNRRATVYFVK